MAEVKKENREFTDTSFKVEEAKEKEAARLMKRKIQGYSDAVETGKTKASEAVEKARQKKSRRKTKASKAIEGASKELESSDTNN